MVKDVSAIFVETTILRPGIPFEFFGGALSNILCYYQGGKVEYKGIISVLPTSSPNSSI